MEPNPSKTKVNDDVDVTQFFSWIGRGFSRVGNAFIYSLATLRGLFFSNRVFFFGIIIFGLILGALYSELLKKKYYESAMVLSCDYLNTQILQNTIDKMNLLCYEKEREGLSEFLGLEPEIAKKIQKFAFKSFVSEDDVVEMEVLRTQLNTVTADKQELVENIIEKLEIENKNAYEIRVQVYEPDVVKPLEKALVTYFRTNDYIKKRIEINKINLEKRRENLLKETRKIDSLKFVLVKNLASVSSTSRGSGNVFLGDEKFANPVEIFEQSLKINNELLNVEHDLYISSDFEVVDGFTTFKEPESASLTKILVISFFLSLLIGYLIIGAWRLDKYLSSVVVKA